MTIILFISPFRNGRKAHLEIVHFVIVHFVVAHLEMAEMASAEYDSAKVMHDMINTI